MYQKVVIVGVGMMGGSLGLALKARRLAHEVAGWGRNEERLESARRLGAVDRWTLSREEALAGADLLVFATPIGTTSALAAEWLPAAPPGCRITDLMSVKGDLPSRLTALTGPSRSYVSSHPLCGSEKTGVESARADLFAGRLCLLTPVAKTKKPALAALQALWQGLGMRVISLAPARHDRILAEVSHLPHLVAAALINRLGEERLLSFTGTGLLDATRIAASDSDLWSEIVLGNRREVLQALGLFREMLDRARRLIEAGEPAALRGWLGTAARRRQTMDLASLAPLAPLAPASAAPPRRVGTVGENPKEPPRRRPRPPPVSPR
ncbi:MAG: prephenate dehydrogenase [Candidatus Aureabacteria bacterium]|nr:prephenate dehydrogenase [Candidatus Auribacterota bacterium]